MTATFTGADAAAAEAYIAAAEAVVRLQASADELEAHLELCNEFAVGHAYAAFLMSLAGATNNAARRAGLAREIRSGITRRERQLVEILLLSVDGDRRRAAALAAEHVEEFADDAVALTVVDRWFQQREALVRRTVAAHYRCYVEFRVLGTLEVLDNGGHPVELRGTKLRTLLAALLLRAGQPVSADRLVDVLWGDDTPEWRGQRAAGAGLEAAQAAGAMCRSRPATAATCWPSTPTQIDAERFAGWRREGHEHLAGGRHAEAAAMLRDGLALWRGPALADFAFDEFAQAHRTRLDEMRLAAIEDRIDADLACGRHEAVAAELEGLVHEHPLRERLWGTADGGALPMRSTVRQPAGLPARPGRAGRRAGPRTGPGAARARAAGARPRRRVLTPPGDRAVVRRVRLSNIHPELSTFVGRERRLWSRSSNCCDERRLVTITGPGGVGKTRIATEIAVHPARAWPRRDLDGRARRSRPAIEPSTRAFQRTFGPRLGHAGGDDTDRLADHRARRRPSC